MVEPDGSVGTKADDIKSAVITVALKLTGSSEGKQGGSSAPTLDV